MHRSPVAWTALVTLLLLLPSGAAAQDDTLADAAWRPGRTRGLAAFERERWASAARSLGPAFDALADWDRDERLAFGCELGAALIRTRGERGIARLRDGLTAAQGDRAFACLAMAADAYASIDEHESAAHFYLAALEGHEDRVLRARFEALPSDVRAAATDARRRLRTQPIGAAVGRAADPQALAERLARWTGRARLTRSASCYPNEEWASGAFGTIGCSYSDAPEPYSFGGQTYPLESFVWARRGGQVEVIAAFPSGTGYDCEAGHSVEPQTPERLRRRRHGIDGWLLRVEDTLEEISIGDEVGSMTRMYAYVCNEASGSCARVEESVRRCVFGERPGQERCSGYVGHTSVRRGRLTIRIDRGELPTALREPIDLTALQPRLPAARSRAVSTSTPMSGCRVEVTDPRPPLNVRARPSTRAPVVGTLADGTPVDVVRGAPGRWVQLRGPVSGFVWSSNLRRRCADASP